MDPIFNKAYPINLGRESVLRLKAYPRVSEVSEPWDLAVIATPAATVPSLVKSVAKRG